MSNTSNTNGIDLNDLNESLKKISKNSGDQITELEKARRVFGISYLLNEFERDMLNDYITKIEMKGPKRNQIR